MCFARPGASVVGRVADGKYIVQFTIRYARESLLDGSMGRHKVDISRVEADAAARREVLGLDDEREFGHNHGDGWRLYKLMDIPIQIGLHRRRAIRTQTALNGWTFFGVVKRVEHCAP